MTDIQRTEPHALSDSEPEMHITEKKKKQPRKCKLSAHSVGSPSGPGHDHSLPVTAATPTAELVPPAHDNNELVEREPCLMR